MKQNSPSTTHFRFGQGVDFGGLHKLKQTTPIASGMSSLEHIRASPRTNLCKVRIPSKKIPKIQIWGDLKYKGIMLNNSMQG